MTTFGIFLERALPFVAGLALGGIMTWLWQRARLARLGERLRLAEARLEDDRRATAEHARLGEENAALRAGRAADAERLAWIHTADEQLRTSFRSLAAEALDANARRYAEQSGAHVRTVIDGAVDGVSRTLSELQAEVRALESARAGAHAGLKEEIGLLRDAHRRLRISASDLAAALRSPTVRGRWGEVQLRRVVEMAGLVEHVDFVEQPTVGAGQRPDLVIRLPDGASLPVDAKAPLGAFIEASEADDEASRAGKLDDHVRAVRGRIDELGKRAYWRAFDPAPDFVVMFLPNDAALAAAFARDPDLLEFALSRQVLPATPVTLLALLKTVAIGWQRQRIADNARTIAAQGDELFGRLKLFFGHLQQLGRSLDGAVAAFNRSVGSLERRVLPSVRKLQEASGTTEPSPEVEPVDRRARQPTASD